MTVHVIEVFFLLWNIAVVKNGLTAEKEKHDTLINIKDGLQLHLHASTLTFVLYMLPQYSKYV